MSDGFLRRWSARKLDAQQGKPLPPAPQQPVEPALPPATQSHPADAAAQPSLLDDRAPAGSEAAGEDLAAVPPAPTLEDVRSLTAQSDFSRFARPDVAPDVKNAALKKLFSDPRYNVMDGLDVYVGDYSQPDPLPAPMLQQLAGAAFLRLFDGDTPKDEQAAAQPRDVADDPEPKTVSQSATAPSAVPEPTDHADPDLRLQQDDAAAGAGPGPGAA